MSQRFDAISLEILRSRLVAIADGSAAASNYHATCLMNATGATQAECSVGVPTFAGLSGRTVRACLQKWPVEDWRNGDVVITNDPWIGTRHLPDMSLIVPVPHRGGLGGFSGTIAYTPDIGGALAGAAA